MHSQRQDVSHGYAVALAILSLLVWPVEFFHLQPGSSGHQCRRLAHDSAWPGDDAWSRLNQSVHGRLLRTTPLGSPCHDPNYDESRCNSLRDAWVWPEEYLASPSTIMSPYFQNASCSPWTPRDTPCTLGNEAEYSIDVSSARDVIAGISFVREHNLRLAIKNTGHDYMGRSAGKGALGLWMHNLKSVRILQYSESYYHGPALHVAAGTLAIDLYTVAAAHQLRVVGGFCPTVGVVGGYTQGGGHGPLASTHGLAADQVLEWEVVTADGRHIITSPNTHADLHWALSGGGAGTFGVVLSMKIRAYEDGPVSGASLVVPAHGLTRDEYWEAFESWQSILPALVDAGATAGYAVLRDLFFVQPITAPGLPSTKLKELLQPFVTKMKALNVNYSLNLTDSPTFMDHYTTYSSPLPRGLFTVHHLFAGRMLPRSAIEKHSPALTSTIRNITDTTAAFMGFVALDVSHRAQRSPVAPNAVFPAWRDTVVTVLAQYTWNYSSPQDMNKAGADLLTNFVVPQLSAFAPDTGTYMNEADFQLGSWKKDFFGANYDRLLKVKNIYDPDGVFYAYKTVGSDSWRVAPDGRLCRARLRIYDVLDNAILHVSPKLQLVTDTAKEWAKSLHKLVSFISAW